MFFEVIASDTRMKILELLTAKPLCVSEICTRLEEEQSKISHSLKKLSACHFIEARKEGKKRIYSLNKETILPLMKLVEKHNRKYCCEACLQRENERRK